MLFPIQVIDKFMENTFLKKNNNGENSAVRDFFKNCGFEVIDNRRDGGRLWIIGEKTDIRDTVNSAITQFGISGKYASSKETNFKMDGIQKLINNECVKDREG